MSLLDDVRRSASVVMEAPRYVRLEPGVVQAYADVLPLGEAMDAELDPSRHYIGEPEATRAYVITLGAVNFGSGYFPDLTKRPGMSGYFTIASSLKDLFEQHGPLSATDLRRLTAVDCCRIFGQRSANASAMELMGLFAQGLNDLGAFLVRDHQGSFRQLLEASDGSAERLVEILAAGMPFYADSGFYKRAQLTAADLVAARVAVFDDLDRLTIFADNLVPHVLRLDGLLVYDPQLVERIESEELIPRGSREEREIRAGAVHAVESIVAALHHRGQPITSMQLDYLLWTRGQMPEYKARPRHRTRTVFY